MFRKKNILNKYKINILAHTGPIIDTRDGIISKIFEQYKAKKQIDASFQILLKALR